MTSCKSQLRSFLVAVIAIAVLLLQSAPAQSQTVDDFLHSLINQKLILRNLGDQQEVKLKKDNVRDLPGSCDLAVIVEAATWDRGTMRFDLEDVGHPWVAGGQRVQGRSCKSVYSNTVLEISGFKRNEQPDSLRAVVSEILLTPEQYLIAHGVSFDLAQGPDDEVAIRTPPPTQAPKTLLAVDPTFSEEARQLKYQGTLLLNVIVGTDGRPHKVRVARPLGKGLDEMAVKVLPMWRFEPARQQEKAVAAEIRVEVSFNLY